MDHQKHWPYSYVLLRLRFCTIYRLSNFKMTHLISFALVEVIIPRVLYWFLNDFIIMSLVFKGTCSPIWGIFTHAFGRPLAAKVVQIKALHQLFLGLVVRKPVFWVLDKARLLPTC